MYFQHSKQLWQDFPGLVPGVLFARGITPQASVDGAVAELSEQAHERLAGAGGQESGLPQIQAWRRAFTSMGLKPTQYRCAAESLLRRFRKEGALPRIHPLIDLCNAASLAFAVPVGVFDLSRITGDLRVGYARGEEVYETFSGAEESPEPGEVIFSDTAQRAHARRWTNRQSGYSAVRDSTAEVLIVAEALHESAHDDVARLVAELGGALEAHWGAGTLSASTVLSEAEPRFGG
ncbi:phenylalanine--tRNA ligase beta subunit-related protein [Streptomyces sp. NBC_01795]|uniref:B3/B4 domain-containing protein n=1 Tax=unclassified Streptomyces TaxID=2593676 RepID=UPI002DD951D9|nr:MULTISPECIES: phenylalanine--tRNA ligase beta subunit-related protein [unclassified Streptomyces]WSA96811.1 phenylalanine--tRNA ligase beta subunit-related protein [Streptomyces sp. NBC_01795]WSB81226.1 phenylalanine--tRNA ligase beta subunit-related protein [Streptomyces sp. NBC_01775]WSS10566.1 phenylalanine--tRNA ligase beta subunit-related protein [Streptomyces sp. NBC_01186]